MTRENAKLLWPIIKAYGEGAKVQMKVVVFGDYRWDDKDDLRFDSDPSVYRIKPQPREFWVKVDTTNSWYVQAIKPLDSGHWIHVREVEP